MFLFKFTEICHLFTIVVQIIYFKIILMFKFNAATSLKRNDIT